MSGEIARNRQEAQEKRLKGWALNGKKNLFRIMYKHRRCRTPSVYSYKANSAQVRISRYEEREAAARLPDPMINLNSTCH